MLPGADMRGGEDLARVLDGHHPHLRLLLLHVRPQHGLHEPGDIRVAILMVLFGAFMITYYDNSVS